MKKAMLSIIILGITIGYGSHAFAQDSIASEPKNIVYGSVGNLVLWFTANANYERLLTTKDARFFSRYYLHFGFGGYAAWGASGRTTDVSLKWLLGRERSHLELGMGIASVFDREGYEIGVSNANYPTPGYEPEPSRRDYRNFIPAATIGYRFQKPDGGFVFRTGIATPDGIYLSVGYAF